MSEEASPFAVAAPKLPAMPAAHQAEKDLLACYLLAPVEIGGYCAEIGVGAEVFHVPSHGIMFDTLADMWAANEPIDGTTLVQRLADRGTLEACGGLVQVADLSAGMPTVANARAYAKLILEKYRLRQLIKTCHQYAREAAEHQEDAEGVQARFEEAAMALGMQRQEKAEVPFRKHILGSLTRMEERAARGNALCGLSYGLKALDDVTGGMSDGEYIVIAAETSGGKTALACGITASVAIDAGHPAAVFSYEMSNEEIADRLLASMGRVDLLNFRKGKITEGEARGVERVCRASENARIFLRDESDMHILQVRAIARRLHRRHGLRLVVVDYAQLVPPVPGKSNESREQEVAKISRNLKAMAKELRLPVVALSQLNDEGRVRESRAIAQDANTLLIIQQEQQEGQPPQHFIKVAKQRSGPQTRVPVTFLKDITRFEDAAPTHRTEAVVRVKPWEKKK